MIDVSELAKSAQAAKKRAYCPYSGYSVGAALESDTGEIVVGCNVENLSYGATICAERTAVTSMVAQEKGRRILQIAVATKDGGTPCGICLQVLSEFMDKGGSVSCISASGEIVTYRLEELMPHAFASKEVERTLRTDPSV